MSKRVIAISVGVSYLDKNKWCVKDLKIGYRLDDTPFWFVSGLSAIFDTESDAEGVAMDIAENMSLPFFFDVKHGQPINPSERRTLKNYGITVK